MQEHPFHIGIHVRSEDHVLRESKLGWRELRHPVNGSSKSESCGTRHVTNRIVVSMRACKLDSEHIAKDAMHPFHDRIGLRILDRDRFGLDVPLRTHSAKDRVVELRNFRQNR